MPSDVRRCDVAAIDALAGAVLRYDDSGRLAALQQALGAQVLHETSDAPPAGGVDLLGQLVDDGGQRASPVELVDDEGRGLPEAVVCPDVLSNSIGWSSIPTISFTPRRRRGMSLLDTLTVLVVVVIGSGPPQVGSKWRSGIGGGGRRELLRPPP